MKKLICFVLIFSFMLTACSKWKVEIVDPRDPVKIEQELVVPEPEKEEKPVEVPEISEDKEPEPEEKSEPEWETEEPAFEDFVKISLYSEDGYNIFHTFSDYEFEEFVSLMNPKEWKEDKSEKDGGGISGSTMLSTEKAALMFVGYDIYGDEIALIKYGKYNGTGKAYLLPKGTVAKIEEFGKKIKRDNPTVFNFPECNYDMSKNAFLNRENDGYIIYLSQLLNYCNWNAAKEDISVPYTGFSSSSELNDKIRFNLFLSIFDRGFIVQGDLAEDAWYNEEDGKYHIPMLDIYTILGKYLEDNSIDMTKTSVNYEFYEKTKTVIIAGGYGITSFRGEPFEVAFVNDNGDGTITAAVDYYIYHMDSADNMILSENLEMRNTMVLRPYENGCKILSHRIEKIGD